MHALIQCAVLREIIYTHLQSVAKSTDASDEEEDQNNDAQILRSALASGVNNNRWRVAPVMPD